MSLMKNISLCICFYLFWFHFWHNNATDTLYTLYTVFQPMLSLAPGTTLHVYTFTLQQNGWKSQLTCLKFLNGTNWTMSRSTGSPLGDLRIPSSPSSICMSLKSAFPTPTMMTDMGRWEAWTMASLVSAMSVMTPSVRMSKMKYCWSCWIRSKNH